MFIVDSLQFFITVQIHLLKLMFFCNFVIGYHGLLFGNQRMVWTLNLWYGLLKKWPWRRENSEKYKGSHLWSAIGFSANWTLAPVHDRMAMIPVNRESSTRWGWMMIQEFVESPDYKVLNLKKRKTQAQQIGNVLSIDFWIRDTIWVFQWFWVDTKLLFHMRTAKCQYPSPRAHRLSLSIISLPHTGQEDKSRALLFFSRAPSSK